MEFDGMKQLLLELIQQKKLVSATISQPRKNPTG